ncbi:hypothetical protein A2U01_0052805, partial [Trifolium medium]|nr:hypothetical protein [Trifolium medium]
PCTNGMQGKRGRRLDVHGAIVGLEELGSWERVFGG